MKDDDFDLNRFLEAQSGIYERVLEELRRGQKVGHWMWFIFPQVRGLGRTETSIFFSISSLDEARAYLQHAVLGTRLLECCDLLMQIEGKSASQIFGVPDDLKLKSSMTLYALAEARNIQFQSVLDHYFQGEPDSRTLELLRNAVDARGARNVREPVHLSGSRL
jgi:uncharacterized protein (DUF1810 family)